MLTLVLMTKTLARSTALNMYDIKLGDVVRITGDFSPPVVGLVVDRRQEKAKHVVNRGGFVDTITIMATSGQTYSIPCTSAWSKKIEVLSEDA